MCAPAPPPAPNPTATAQAQTASNQATAKTQSELNNINQVTPYGSLTYDQTGSYEDGTPKYTQTVSLSPAQQNLLDMTQQGERALGQTALGSLGNVQNTYSNPFSFGGPQITGSTGNSGAIQTGLNLSGVPAIQSTVQNQSGVGITGKITNGANDAQAIRDAENAAFYQQANWLAPQFAQAHQATDAKLANMGLSVGDTGYGAGQQILGQQENQAYGNAAYQAVGLGQAEQAQLFGQGLSAANLQNSANAQGFSQGLQSAGLANEANAQAYNQALTSGNFANASQQQQYNQNLSNAQLQNNASQASLQQQLALYNQPLNQYNALMTGAQVQPFSFQPTNPATMAGTNVAGITQSSYQDQLQRYQAQQSGINNLFSLGGQLGAAAILA
jgi:hypothetical protein